MDMSLRWTDVNSIDVISTRHQTSHPQIWDTRRTSRGQHSVVAFPRCHVSDGKNDWLQACRNQELHMKQFLTVKSLTRDVGGVYFHFSQCIISTKIEINTRVVVCCNHSSSITSPFQITLFYRKHPVDLTFPLLFTNGAAIQRRYTTFLSDSSRHRTTRRPKGS